MSRPLDEPHRDEWHDADDPPDSRRSVLVLSAHDSAATEGYFHRGEWFICGHPCSTIAYWREMPKAPPQWETRERMQEQEQEGK